MSLKLWKRRMTGSLTTIVKKKMRKKILTSCMKYCILYKIQGLRKVKPE